MRHERVPTLGKKGHRLGRRTGGVGDRLRDVLRLGEWAANVHAVAGRDDG